MSRDGFLRALGVVPSVLLLWLLAAATITFAQAEPGPDAAVGRAVVIEPAAGVGLGLLTMDIPIDPGVVALQETAFPAAEAILTAHVLPHRRFSLDASLAYRTSLSLSLQQEPLFGLPEDIHLRYQWLAIGVGPVLRLSGRGRHPFVLGLSLGFAMTVLTPLEKMYPLQELVMGGPTLGVEARSGLSERFWVRLGADAQALPLISGSLRDQGVDRTGMGIGGHAVLGADLSQTLSARLYLREFHQLAPAASARVQSRLRLITLGLGGTL